jgi:Flp pilus assembly protein TadB
MAPLRIFAGVVMDITNQPRPAQTHITERPAEQAAPDDLYQMPGVQSKKTDFLGYFLLLLGVVAVTALMAVIGGWPLVSVTVVVAGLGLIHYFTWGRSLNRQVAQAQAEEFRRRLELDQNNLSEVERPRHY